MNECAHDACECQVSDGEEYCSEACRDADVGGTPSDECPCDHPACSV